MDYIYVYDENNNKLKMQVVIIFNLKNYKENYIIYCKPDKSHYYLAKYNDNIRDLNTQFSENELKLCNKVFEGLGL